MRRGHMAALLSGAQVSDVGARRRCSRALGGAAGPGVRRLRRGQGAEGAKDKSIEGGGQRGLWAVARW